MENINKYEDNLKIWISNIDSKLGYHLVQLLRNDHTNIENHHYIVGSTSHTNTNAHTHAQQHDDIKQRKHTSIHKILKYNGSNNQSNTNQHKHKIEQGLIAKCVQQCDIVILDLTKVTEQTQFIIKSIEWRAKRKQSSINNKLKNVKIIGIGSHMTWAHQKIIKNDQKQLNANKCISLDQPKQEMSQNKIKNSDRSKYIPHHEWVKQRQLQKKILQLNKYQNICSKIITTGLIYGRDIPSPQLQDLVYRCTTINQDIWITGDGSNLLPTVHVDHVCSSIQKILSLMTNQLRTKTNKIQHKSNTSNLPGYFIAVDAELATQKQIVQQLLKYSGLIKQIKIIQLYHITRQEALYSHSINLQNSKILNHQHNCQSILSYLSASSKYLQLQNCLQLNPYHLVLYVQEMQPTIAQKLIGHLQSVMTVFKEDNIVQKICSERAITSNEIDIHQVSHRIENQYLKKRHTQAKDSINYVLVLNQILLDVNVIQKYQLNKFEIQHHAPLILSHKYEEYTQEYKINKINQQKSRRNSKQTNIIEHNSNNACTPVPQKQQDLINQKINQNIEQQVIDQATIKRLSQKNKQYRRIDQYLHDNVMRYVSQAFFNLRNKQNVNLREFTQQLKHIYQRQSTILLQQKEDKQNSNKVNQNPMQLSVPVQQHHYK